MAKEDVKTGELVTATPSGGALENLPAFVDRGDRSGKDDIQSDEIRLPRLGIAQGLSPQMTPGDTQYIKGLAIGEMFNDLTGEVYGTTPLKFIPVKRDVRRIEFIPRAEGGGVRDLDVPANDSRNEWTEGEDGQRQAPLATRFTEFVSLLLKDDGSFEPIVISIKETNKHMSRAAKTLTTYISLRSGPIFSGVYSAETMLARNDSGTFGVFVFRNAGSIKAEQQDIYEFARDLHNQLATKRLVVNREEGGVHDQASGPAPF